MRFTPEDINFSMLKIDLHLHTIVSGHAYNTILEYIEQAKKLKMKVIGFSEHGPKNVETIVTDIYFRHLRRIPKVVNGIRILKGVEANIINEKGDIDLDDKIIQCLDYVMGNCHYGTAYKDQGREMNTKTLVNAIYSGKIQIITHPFTDAYYDIDIKEVSDEACKNNVLLEVNLAYLKNINENSLANLKNMIDIVRKKGKKIIIGSDAHTIWEMADDSHLQAIKEEIGLTDDLIINNYPEELFRFLGVEE